MDSNILEGVKEVIYEKIEGLEETAVTAESKLKDFNINSISFIKIVVALEEKFDIQFGDDDLDASKFETVGDIVQYVEKEMDK
jgi:acyl carrier protein